MPVSPQITIALICILLNCVTFIHSDLISLDMKIKEISSNNFNSTISSYAADPYDLRVLTQKLLTLQTCIGNPPQCFDLAYDTGSFVPWVSSVESTGCYNCKHYNSSLSNSYENLTKFDKINYVTGYASGFRSSDIIQLSNETIGPKINFLLVNESGFNVKGADGIIGFGRNFNSAPKEYSVTDDSSIMEQLFRSGKIKYKVFSQKYTDQNKTLAKLYIGDYHEDFSASVQNKTILGSCKVFESDHFWVQNPTSYLWTCRLSHLIFTSNVISEFVPLVSRSKVVLYEKALIDSGANYIFYPIAHHKHFQEYFKSQPNCNYEKYSISSSGQWLCSDLDPEKLEKISFVFNGYSIMFRPDEMFFTHPIFNSIKVFKLMSLEADIWLLGQFFMENLHILFDDDKKRILFTQNDEILNGQGVVFDERSWTTENDFVLEDYIIYIVPAIALIILIIIIVVVCVCCKKKKIEPTSVMRFASSNNYVPPTLQYNYQPAQQNYCSNTDNINLPVNYNINHYGNNNAQGPPLYNK